MLGLADELAQGGEGDAASLDPDGLLPVPLPQVPVPPQLLREATLRAR